MPQTPNFFLVGAAKAGTTALWRYLGQHPEIAFSPIKETHFFSTDIDTTKFRPEFANDAAFDVGKYIAGGMKQTVHQAFVRDEAHYAQLFSKLGSAKAVGEATVSYLWSEQAAANIKAYNPNAKILMMLRHPAERAFSHFLMDLRMGYATGSFQQAVLADLQKEQGWGISNLYLDLGRYAQQVQRYIDVFPKSQILLLDYSDYKADPNAVLKRIFQFLEVSDQVVIDTSERHNAAALPKYGAMQKALKSDSFKRLIKSVVPKSMVKGLRNSMYTTEGLPSLTEDDRAFVMHYLGEDWQHTQALLTQRKVSNNA